MRIYVLEMYLKLMANDCGYWKVVALDNGRIYDVVDGNKILVWSFQ